MRRSLLVLLPLVSCLACAVPAGAAPYGASGGEAPPETLSGATLAPDVPVGQPAAAPRAVAPETAPATSAPVPAPAGKAESRDPVARAAQTPVEPEPGVPGGGEDNEDAPSGTPPRAEPQGDAPGDGDSGGLPMSGGRVETILVVGVLLLGLGLTGVAIARGRALSKY